MTHALKQMDPHSYTRAGAQLSPEPMVQGGVVVPTTLKNNNPSIHPSSTVDAASEYDAIHALERRGIDNPERVLDLLSPERILATCEWYDRQQGARTGVLVWKIRNGGVEPSAVSSTLDRPRSRPVYDDSGLPVLFMAHADWDKRRDFTVSCADGQLMAVAAVYPIVTVECDRCGFLAGLGHRGLTPELRTVLGVAD